MSVKYDFKTNPFVKEGEKQVLYPSIVVAGTKTTDDIVADIAKHSVFSPGCVQGVLSELSDYIVQQLREGYIVKIDELGSFSATLTSRRITEKSEIRAASITFDKVHFRAAPCFLKSVRNGVHLERARYGFNESLSLLTKEERLEVVKRYLQEHEFMTRLVYSELTGLLRSSAARELDSWVAEGILVKRGRRAQTQFVLA